jgi:hypothetical protein
MSHPTKLEMTAQGGHQDWMLGTSSLQASSSQGLTNIIAHPVPQRHYPPLILTMANRGYDAVVDVDTEVRTLPLRPQTATLTKGFPKGDLGHTDLQDDDLEFHSSSMSA